ncbi:MAG: hypothetical protein GY925_01740, partial [Actinomycetia bacterium]|nr:hypothetical protein [Actinomycetes bacterium]
MALRRVAYVDESERGSRVLLAGTVIVGDDAPAVRQVMLSARPAGVAVLH